MKIALASDQPHEVVDHLALHLQRMGHELLTRSGDGPAQVSWVDIGTWVGRLVASGQARYGIACCDTGAGVAIAANKLVGVRAVVCRDADSAQLARFFNHANVLGIALRWTTVDSAAQVLTAWLQTPNGALEHRQQIERLAAFERAG